MILDTARRTFLKGVGLVAGMGAAVGTARSSEQPTSTESVKLNSQEKIKVAGITTVYRPNSHSDVQLGSIIQGYGLDGPGGNVDLSFLELASLYTDQVPENDISRELARRYLFPITETVEEALTLGTDELAVDAVYLCLEHGDYPKSPTGNTQYPKRRLFEEVVAVFEATGEVVPVFMDKHIHDNWEDAKWIYDKAQEMNIPMMAGSSLPIAWRQPGTRGRPLPNVERGANLEEAAAVSISSLDGGSFHGLELLQSLVERRDGGETGIEAVQGLEGDDVWQAGETGVYDKELLFAALNRDSSRKWSEDDWGELQDTVGNPVVWIIDYMDGLRASVFTLPGAARNWTAAWRYDQENREIGSCQSDLQYARPFAHHGLLVKNVGEMFATGEPVYPVERTLLVSGALNELLRSVNLEDGARIETPFLDVTYQTDWEWDQPVPRPPGRSTSDDFPPNFPWHIPISFDSAKDVITTFHDRGMLMSQEQARLLGHLSTAERQAKSGHKDAATKAIERFIAVASDVKDAQTKSDLVFMGENLKENQLITLSKNCRF